ncbi:MAG TPA: glycosyltransferase family 1 protein [Bryobacteraceae bacterium]|nr:glycosyltransferase family 1 protein [Bryobacteraceae bacterium]
MRFAVDAHAIGQHLTGNETYVRNLLNCFASLDRESEFVTYLSRQNSFRDVPGRFEKRRVAVNPFLRLGYDLPRALRQDRPSLLHVQYTAPLFCPVPVVVSVHDVSFLEYPEYFTTFRALQLRCTVERTVRSAAAVLTPSEFSKHQILRAYALDERKVIALPNGVSSAFRPAGRVTSQRSLQAKFGFQFPFILTVGDLQPRKNHLGLIRAFEQLLRAFPHLPHHLVIVGKETWYASHIRAAARKSEVAGRIHFTGFVDDSLLHRFYGACDLFVYPSFYEGFGLPILEAMACGRAVACSNTSAMPEVADSAAILFNPSSEQDLVLAMRDILLNAELRARLERLGVQRASMFNWQDTAAKTLELYYGIACKTSRRPKDVPARAVKSTSAAR